MQYKDRIIELPQNRVWRSYLGGRILDELVGKTEPADSHFPEDWIGSVTAANNPDSHGEHEGISKVSIDGQELLLPDLIAKDPEYFLGADHVARYGQQPMVLIKLLDASVRLQLQAHPTADFAKRHLDSDSGKAEAYYILDVREDAKQGNVDQAYVYLGFQRPPSRDDLRSWIEEQNMAAILDCFDKIHVKPGDVLFIPGGVPHAIGEGIFMVEIMEPSDLVVRFEFERAGYTLPESARFMNRGLEFCLDIFDFEAKPEDLVRRDFMFQAQREATYGDAGHRDSLIGPETTPCFRVKKSTICGSVQRTEDSFFAGVVTSGECIIRTAEHELKLKRLSKFFCPAGLGSYTIEAEREVQILECFPPMVEG
ncbi:class I mannose-6-phosphate isomerase [Adhaeretor mobilis]|uniref:Putative mannose-6-phosphate isomerase GmuF n=1 Tax=Adhaeretor mobilis TaxID=1930276 RepID=A0A517N1Q5_9BACT|nr:class I mannose-6-phosphate isomerase [Adhaeretor mobilis]QDT01066.1 putative mannose-6-phosphate isomerase GmuF [Adhaeretor mobilis]